MSRVALHKQVLGPDLTERVFPIRSVVTLDSSSPSPQHSPTLTSPGSPILRVEEGLSGCITNAVKTLNQEFPASLDKTDELHNLDVLQAEPFQKSKEDSHGPLMVRRTSKAGLVFSGISSVNDSALCSQNPPSGDIHGGSLTGNRGLPCATETKKQYSTPLKIHCFGALVGLQETEGKLETRFASNNSKAIIGHSPAELFQMSSFLDILPQDQKELLLVHLKFVSSANWDMEENGPDFLTLTILTPAGDRKEFFCTMHAVQASPYIMLEIEPEFGPSKDQTIESQQPDSEDCSNTRNNDSYEKIQKYLEVFRDFREQPDQARFINLVSKIHQVISNVQSLDTLIDSSARIYKELTGFPIVSVCRLDDAHDLTVVAEFKDPNIDSPVLSQTTTKDFLQQNPGRRGKVDILCKQRDGVTDLVYGSSKHAQDPVDISSCYLSTEGVYPHDEGSAGLSISIKITAFDSIWGAIICQSTDPTVKVHPLIRRMCWLLSDVVSSNIARISCTAPLNSQAMVDLCPTAGFRYLQESSSPEGMLDLFDANFAALSISGETKILGKPPDAQDVLILVEYLKLKKLDTVVWSTDIRGDFQDLTHSPGFSLISGILYVPLLAEGRDFIIFFKAGSPRSKELLCNTGTQDQGEYFSAHHDSICQKGWSRVNLDTASLLSVIYRTFTETWKQKEAAMHSTQLMRLLLANAAHEFRTPLNAIINYLEIALDGPLKQETREILSTSHSASKSLVYIINDLLDLTHAENGKTLIKDEIFNLSETIREAMNIFGAEAGQKNIKLQIVEHTRLPLVLGDQRRVRQVITNMISNAIHYTSSGAVTIESTVIPGHGDPNYMGIEVAIHDTGSGMPQETVEALFCELEQVETPSTSPQSQDSTPGNTADTPSDSKNVLGLGLALVARIVHNMDGQLTVKSEEGKGSCFRIRLNFPVPEGENLDEIILEAGSPHIESKVLCEDYTLKEQENQPPTAEKKKPGISTTQLESSPEKRTRDSPERDEDRRKISDLPSSTGLHVLAADDDPVNSTILRKRLEKFGHTVHMTGNGKECASVHREHPGRFDAILMDLQMPIVDGVSSTKMIRELEAEAREKAAGRSPGRRIPIFAVSASLSEKDRELYMATGFDGWMMKPIDFHRANHLLKGVRQVDVRDHCIYQPGQWESGGWFERHDLL
ncbi:hypothetical protein ASPZODRAFT_803145 [Penicilliopsis zonata CBS 506.65]|uniref:histidine kinase n=1 Tax=Penicilliopsis zonata CBS 506.65 TaxID=1073090 RepID=A0A1L9SA09_9EURO|nr:hypothetical protein ASPZODRAFT_803145 [Penicilliopsis zonata CBS 506.65]OJJ43971.1 hypothetical protein ASPZODRAFT_803145 [Penicilliopsis zonata CBS 506.65]